MTDKKDDKKGKLTLEASDIEKSPVNRRNVLRGFGIGTLGLGTAAVTGCVPTTGVIVGTGYTDADNGPIIDPVGNGRGPRRSFYTGITDADNGPIVDPGGYGRG